MSTPIISRIAATGLALTLLTTAALAGEVAVHGVKTTGALTLVTQGLATDANAVHRQGGHAVPGAVLWLTTPAHDERVRQSAAF